MEDFKKLKLELEQYYKFRDMVSEKRKRAEELLKELDNENEDLNTTILEMEKQVKDFKDAQVKVPEVGVKIDFETFSQIVNAVSFAVTYGGCDKELLDRTIALGKASEKEQISMNINEDKKKQACDEIIKTLKNSSRDVIPMEQPQVIEITSIDDLIKVLGREFVSNENTKNKN